MRWRVPAGGGRRAPVGVRPVGVRAPLGVRRAAYARWHAPGGVRPAAVIDSVSLKSPCRKGLDAAISRKPS
ncbi:hypothetical protein MILUP08_43312 [Micromonospora lupini str. Lupac 08]|uniref:Uncharacterized protein n=1 Tax=Micromonospora lupini str. Lupac 08 TaxID=1150864 RepID=I0L3K5_9ACTN|nr:hypothetical protein MILUP08_43312 [Micromonospora lupini str. Lupac 08]